jgi:Na+/melibiose symporter-like transporter
VWGIVGGLAGLAAWLLVAQSAALAVGVAVGGVAAMVVAAVAGVWAGALATLGHRRSGTPQDARRQLSCTWWVVNRLLFLAAVTSVRGFATYFLMYAFRISLEEATKMSGALLTIVGLATLVAALASGWLADVIGRKRLVGLSGIVAALGAVILLWTI